MGANNGGPAFPSVDHVYRDCAFEGMTLRDYFAAKAMQGILANPEWLKLDGFSPGGIAKCAWEYADAMLAARDNNGARP